MWRFLTAAGVLVLCNLVSPQHPSASSEGDGPAQAGIALEQVHEWRCDDGCDGADAELLGQVRSQRVAPDGTVVVVDNYPPYVRVWSASGALRAWFSEEGQGPGAMQAPMHLSIHGTDMLSIVDHRNGLWTIFTMAGEVVHALRLSGRFATGAAFSPAHQALLSAVRGRSDGHCSPPEILETGVIDGVTSRLATILDAPTGGNDDCPQDIYSFDAAPAGGFVVGFGSPDYVLQEYGRDGSLVREIRHDIERVPKTKRELDAERAASQQGRVTGLSRDVDVEPAHYHFYGGAIRYDTDGRIWVRTPRGRQEATLFDVFENGTLLTTVAAPVITPLKGNAFDVGGHYLLVVAQDDSSNPTLHLFRVTWK